MNESSENFGNYVNKHMSGELPDGGSFRKEMYFDTQSVYLN